MAHNRDSTPPAPVDSNAVGDVGELGQALASIRLPSGATSLADLGANARVEVIDQLLLPGVVRWFEVADSRGAYDAIKSMQVRLRCSYAHNALASVLLRSRT